MTIYIKSFANQASGFDIIFLSLLINIYLGNSPVLWRTCSRQISLALEPIYEHLCHIFFPNQASGF